MLYQSQESIQWNLRDKKASRVDCQRLLPMPSTQNYSVSAKFSRAFTQRTKTRRIRKGYKGFLDFGVSSKSKIKIQKWPRANCYLPIAQFASNLEDAARRIQTQAPF